MTATQTVRDYRLIGAESERAVERGLAEGQWFQADVAPERMRGAEAGGRCRRSSPTGL